jgi:hypothetical protein
MREDNLEDQVKRDHNDKMANTVKINLDQTAAHWQAAANKLMNPLTKRETKIVFYRIDWVTKMSYFAGIK